MKTPKEYTKNLKNHIITEDMIADCLYSVNKRAKNFRDKAQEYRNSYYHGISQQDDMRRYYSYKEQLLSFFEPKCIHKQFVGYSRIRVYDYEDDYYNQNNRNIVWENCYYDHEEDREVWFYDLRSNMPNFGKTNPLKYEHFQEFIECYSENDFSKRKETYSAENPQGRWRKYTIEEIIARDKTSLDITWLKQGEETEDIPLDELLENIEEKAANIMNVVKKLKKIFG